MNSIALLTTLLNLHDGLQDGGKGIEETDWQAVRDHIKNSKSRKRIKLSDPMKIYMASMGKVFRITHICLDMDEANSVLEKNKDIACIAEDNNGLVYLAEQYGSIAPSEILNDLRKK